MSNQFPIRFFTVQALARRSGASRSVVHRLVSQGVLKPAAQLEFTDGALQPLFSPTAVDLVVAHIQPPKFAGGYSHHEK